VPHPYGFQGAVFDFDFRHCLLFSDLHFLHSVFFISFPLNPLIIFLDEYGTHPVT
jgi:hypothetical protein